MLKAIFMDFYGTAAYEISLIAIEVITKIYKSSNANSMEEITEYWWRTFRERLSHFNGENFRTQHDIALENFQNLLKHFCSDENPAELLRRMEEHWRTTPIYDDVKPFMDNVPYPVYFVTNSDDDYVFSAVKNHALSPAGVITSEQAKYSKPRKEIFQYALEKINLKSNEVIHIGDSLTSDVECPSSIGIKAIWLNRENKEVPTGVTSATELKKVLDLI